MSNKKLSAALALGVAVLVSSSVANAATCIGNCGTDGADGVVTLSPTGNSSYNYISTAGGVTGVGQIPGVPYAGTNGSQYTSNAFTATSGQALTFYFNYVTSDGSGFPDYAWAKLVNTSTPGADAYLFTAATTPFWRHEPWHLPARK